MTMSDPIAERHAAATMRIAELDAALREAWDDIEHIEDERDSWYQVAAKNRVEIERLRADNTRLANVGKAAVDRAERAEAERDALLKLLRDWRGTCACHNDDIGSLIDAALAKGEGK